MDLSKYYKEFESTYRIAIVALILMFLVTIFVCVRRIKDNSKECNRIWKKVLFCIGYISLFMVVLGYYFSGPYLAKRDTDQKTIYYYEGDFDILSTSHRIYNKATFSIENENITLKYFEDENYDFDSITPGSYEGKLVYAQNAATVLYIEIYQSE